jgi:hypothetical protein
MGGASGVKDLVFRAYRAGARTVSVHVTRYCCFFDHVRRDSPCDGDYKLNRLRSRGRVYQVEGHDNMIKN